MSNSFTSSDELISLNNRKFNRFNNWKPDFSENSTSIQQNRENIQLRHNTHSHALTSSRSTKENKQTLELIIQHMKLLKEILQSSDDTHVVTCLKQLSHFFQGLYNLITYLFHCSIFILCRSY